MPVNHSGIDQKQSPGGAMINAVVAHIKAFAGYYKEKFAGRMGAVMIFFAQFLIGRR